MWGRCAEQTLAAVGWGKREGFAAGPTFAGVGANLTPPRVLCWLVGGWNTLTKQIPE